MSGGVRNLDNLDKPLRFAMSRGLSKFRNLRQL